MRWSGLAGGGLLLLPASVAGAHAQTPPVSSAGPYLGLHLGAGSVSEKLTESTSFDPPQTGHASRDSTGFAGGAHAGFNWQFGSIVFGPEGDIEGIASSHASRCLVQDAGVGTAAPGTCFSSAANGYRFSTTIDWQASLRARLGYAFGDALFYGTGGAAFTAIRTSYAQSLDAVNGAQTFTHTRPGFTVGGGLEYYGKFTDNTASAGPFWDGYSNHHRIRENTVRIGLTYALGAP